MYTGVRTHAHSHTHTDPSTHLPSNTDTQTYKKTHTYISERQFTQTTGKQINKQTVASF